MTKTRTKTQQTNFLSPTVLLWGGLALLVGWSLILGITTWRADLACWLSPNNCSESYALALAILFTPIVIGSIAAPIGFLYDMKMARENKFFITLLAGGALLFLAYWLVIFATIATHGLGA